MSDCNCPLSLGPDCPNCSKPKKSGWRVLNKDNIGAYIQEQEEILKNTKSKRERNKAETNLLGARLMQKGWSEKGMDKLKRKALCIYVAGPYTTGDQFENVGKAIDVAEQVMAVGGVPFCPHLAAFWNMKHPHTWQEWMDFCLCWVGKCDCVLRMPGASKGADQEVEYAKRLGLPVFFSVEEMVSSMNLV
jgi:hypothetical protein